VTKCLYIIEVSSSQPYSSGTGVRYSILSMLYGRFMEHTYIKRHACWNNKPVCVAYRYWLEIKIVLKVRYHVVSYDRMLCQEMLNSSWPICDFFTYTTHWYRHVYTYYTYITVKTEDLTVVILILRYPVQMLKVAIHTTTILH